MEKEKECDHETNCICFECPECEQEEQECVCDH